MRFCLSVVDELEDDFDNDFVDTFDPELVGFESATPLPPDFKETFDERILEEFEIKEIPFGDPVGVGFRERDGEFPERSHASVFRSTVIKCKEWS